MADPTPLAPLQQILHRLEAIEQSLELIEGLLELMDQRLAHIEAQHATDHYGFGRGGLAGGRATTGR